MSYISKNLELIKAAIGAAETKYGRVTHNVKLLAVSKQQPIAKILEAVAGGQRCFGENYCQEAMSKITALAATGLEWHFIGAVQANKTRAIAENFAWVHSVARAKIAERLNKQRPAQLPPINVCIEVNLSSQTTKSGVLLAEVEPLAQLISQMPRLRLRGLMAIPETNTDFAQQRAVFERLHHAFIRLQQAGYLVDTLSMGMSGDYPAAIAAGSTVVRIGTAIFGERPAWESYDTNA